MGDQLLKEFTATTQSSLRKSDIFVRLGGDEFAIIFPETVIDNALHIIERCRKDIKELMQQNNWPVPVSIGFVSFKNFEISVDEMLHIADELMYSEKKSGKDGIATKEYV